NSTVLYYNDRHPHLESIEDAYLKYVRLHGEAPFEDRFAVSGAPIHVLGLPSAGLGLTRASALYRERADEVYCIRTSRGAVFEVTKAHRFLTVTTQGVQWVPAVKLLVGDPVAAPKSIPMEGGSLSEDDAYFLGLFVAEGTANPVSLCNADQRIIDGVTYYVIFVVGFDRDGLRLPMLTKKIPSFRTHNSSHGYPTRIPRFLAMIYRRALGGGRGRRKKAIGGATNEAETFYHVLTRSRYERKTINDVTFRRIVQEFLAGHERLHRAKELAETLDTLANLEFAELVNLLPFAYETLADDLELSRSALRNYLWRGLPQDPTLRTRLREALLSRITDRLRVLEEA